jgi:pimeloyl-ACP methyl ester carboxylesterase
LKWSFAPLQAGGRRFETCTAHQRPTRAWGLPDFANGDWAYGTNRAYLEELVAYWRERYDWRKHEAEINRISHYRNYRTTIDGIPIHFIHEPGKGPKPIPLILSDGWPWTFWDLAKVIRPLVDPASFGSDPADVFDVVVPLLSGFCFSTPLTAPGINWWRTADLWVTLMLDVLGYSKFAAESGDWGAFVTQQLGHKYPQHLTGIYLNFAIPMDFFMSLLLWAVMKYTEAERASAIVAEKIRNS